MELCTSEPNSNGIRDVICRSRRLTVSATAEPAQAYSLPMSSSSEHTKQPIDAPPVVSVQSNIESSFRYFAHDYAALTRFYEVMKFRAKKQPYMLKRNIALHTKGGYNNSRAKSSSHPRPRLEVSLKISREHIAAFIDEYPHSNVTLIVALVSCDFFFEDGSWQEWGNIVDCKELLLDSRTPHIDGFDQRVTFNATNMYESRDAQNRMHFFVTLALRQQPKIAAFSDLALLSTEGFHYKTFLFDNLNRFFSGECLQCKMCLLELLPKAKTAPHSANVNRSRPTSSSTRAFSRHRTIPYVSGTKVVNLADTVTNQNGNGVTDGVTVSVSVSVAPASTAERSKRKVVPEESSCSSSTAASEKASLYFHYVYHDRLIDILKSYRQKCGQVLCPFCDYRPCTPDAATSIEVKRSSSSSAGSGVEWRASSRRSLSRLMHHLTCCHSIFLFECVTDQMGNLHVMVMRNDSYLAEEERKAKNAKKSCLIDHDSFYLARNERWKLHNYTFKTEVLTKRSPYYVASDSNIASLAIRGRTFFHSLSGTVVTDSELSYDSDNDIDSTFIVLENNAAIDEFVDIAFEEKEFFKMWNSFIRAFNVHGDIYMSHAVELFVRRFADAILAKGLRHNLLLHIMNLWDFGLVDKATLSKCMRLIDAVEASRKGMIVA